MTALAPRPVPARGTAGEPYPRRDPITELPVLILEPHSRCNCRCLMCDIWKEREAKELTAAEVRSWLPDLEALGVKRVVLTGGEPLMHSDLFALCTPLAEAGIGLTLLSSGLLLSRHAEAIARWVDDLIVSLDGPREVHDAIRNVPRAYDRMREGIAAVRAAADARGAAIAISGRSTVQRDNFRHLRATVAAAHELGLDRISFLAADVSSEAFNRPGGWDGERRGSVALTENELPRLAAELDVLVEENAADFASGYIAESPAKLGSRLLGYFSALLGKQAFTAPECNAPWVSAVVEPGGTIRPCFFHPSVGNAREAGLAAALNSSAALDFRRRLDVASDPICRRCVCSLNLRREAT